MDYDLINSSLQLQLEATVYRISATAGSKRFISHQMKLFSENVTPAFELQGSFDDKTCIVLGGGPSLDEHMDWIKENQENLVIIAVSRLAKKLKSEGLTPHIIFSVDPDIGSFDIGKELLTLPPKVLFVFSHHACAELVSQWHGKSAYIGPRYQWESKLEKSNVMPHGPTVTNTAIMAAVDIGFKRILLAGVDLCYAKNGITHTKGTDEAEAGPFLSQDGQWVETYAGEKALTDIQLVHAIKCIAEQGQYAEEHGTEVINLSQNAARIEHVSHISPQEITIVPSEDNIWEMIDRKIPYFDSKLYLDDNKIALKELEKILKSLKEIDTLSKEALKINQSLFKKSQNNEYNAKFKVKLDKIHSKLTKKYGTESILLQSYGADFFREFIKPAITDEWKDKELELSRKLYYEAMVHSVTSVNELIDNTKKRTLSRIDEESQNPNFNKLIEQWKEDNQIGRAKLWIERHPDTYKDLDKQTQSKLETLSNDFDDIITNTNTDWAKMCKINTTLSGVQRKADKMILQRNKDGLTHLAGALEKIKEKGDQEKSLHHLCQGYLLILTESHNKEAAIEALEKVGDDEKQEQALKQLLTLYLDIMDTDKAESCLERLSAKSSAYTPHYAEMLKLQNKLEESIYTYTEYLKDNAEDIPTWISLGKLYVEINEAESARMVFELVLEHDENNQIAQHYMNAIHTYENM
jgi:tetratricopeptide (TPR) repeat protein